MSDDNIARFPGTIDFHDVPPDPNAIVGVVAGDGGPCLPVRVFIKDVIDPDKYVGFLVDNGSERTAIHYDSALKLGIPVEELDSGRWTDFVLYAGMGGDAGLRLRSFEGRFGFDREDGQVMWIEGQVLIGDIATKGKPSLLGRDLLQRFLLVIDGPNAPVLRYRRERGAALTPNQT